MQVPPTWRELLAELIQNSQERQRIANELGVNPLTLTRWVNNESKPRPQNLRRLLAIFPHHRDTLLRSLAQEFPEFSFSAKDKEIEDQVLEIPSEFYARVHATYVTTHQNQLFWAISNLVLQQALGHLDPYQTGMALTIAQCMPPSPGHKVRSLRERLGRGTPPWPFNLDEEAIFLGSESLVGYAVSKYHPVAIQDASEPGVFPAHWTAWEHSAAALPIMRLNASAGCLLASSTQPEYFLPARQRLLQNYAILLVLAFTPQEFYEPQEIDLQPMPFYRTQKTVVSKFRQRLSSFMHQAQSKGRAINMLEAEQVVWQEIEEDLLGLPPYTGDESDEKAPIQEKELTI
jgi:transcriptional regulator with XRE-family HTH domain